MKAEPYEHAIHRLKGEIRCLTEKQMDDMETATFLGLTADENEAHEARRAKIVELVRQLRLLEAAA